MIKIGCMDLSFRRYIEAGKMDLEGFIEKAYQMHVDGIEIHSRNLRTTEPAYLRDLRLRAMRRGLPIGYMGVSNDFGKLPEELPFELAKVKSAVDIASFMAIPMVRVFAAWLRTGEDEQVVWKRSISCLEEVAAYGEEKGVVIGLQNHNHLNVTKTGRDIRRILDQVDSPFLTHILDTGQYVGSLGASGPEEAWKVGRSTQAVYESIEETAPLAVYVRCKFYRVQDGEEAWLDYPRIVEILRKAGYNGFLSVVYEGWQAEPAETAVPKALNQLRSLLRG
jgi:sugar phosphate isomerase/epimerase